MYRYHASRGGHAPGHPPQAFVDWSDSQPGFVPVERWVGSPCIDEMPVDLNWLIGQLWNCTDIMPGGLCDDLELPRGAVVPGAVSPGGISLEPARPVDADRIRGRFLGRALPAGLSWR